MKAKCIFHFFILFAISFSVQAQNQVVKIWPTLAPGSENLENKEEWTEGKNVSNVYQPDLTIFLPEHQAIPAPAVVVFPGGGYTKIVMEKEGYKVARWLNENGIVAFVLKYRLNRDEALRDAQRAVSVIRKDAGKYGIDKNKIGVIGFSAGAHLACNLVMNNQDRENYDAIDTVSSRPDFWIGVYGVYSGIDGVLGKSRFIVNTPPAFLVHAGNDSKVPVLSSVELYIDLKNKGVPAELHVYEQGEHGFALEEGRGAAIKSTVTDWSKRCIEWLKLRGIL
ncbi:MAG: alpha/beta hydrolase [Bacteroidia bacterium]|nr:alpha/beta hydrolase [Bacteroidia bacterium]